MHQKYEIWACDTWEAETDWSSEGGSGSYGYIVGTCFKNIRRINRSFISHISIAKCKPTLFKSSPKRPKLILQTVITETLVNFIKCCYSFIGERLFKSKLEFYKKGEWIFGLWKTSRSHLIMSDFQVLIKPSKFKDLKLWVKQPLKSVHAPLISYLKVIKFLYV